MSIVKNAHRISEELRSNTNNSSPKEKLTVSQICVDFINKNIDKNITVQMISDATFISPSHILHQFKKEMDITLHQYIIFQKIQIAKVLLAKGTNPLTVAKQLGYDYYSTFYNNYVKHCGNPPDADRNNLGTTKEKNVIT